MTDGRFHTDGAVFHEVVRTKALITGDSLSSDSTENPMPNGREWLDPGRAGWLDPTH